MSDSHVPEQTIWNSTQGDILPKLSAEVERLAADIRAKEEALALKEQELAAKSKEVESLTLDLRARETILALLERKSEDKPQANNQSLQWLSFERICRYVELFSFAAIIITGLLAYLEFRNHVQKQQNAVAEEIYRDVDDRFIEYIQTAIPYPRLDVYSIPRSSPLKPPLTEDEKMQQRMLYSNLTDVFEVAYVQYHKTRAIPDEVRENFFKQQWPGWDAYIKKFLVRPAYQKVWSEIHDEYDEDFARYMDHIRANIVSSTAPEELLQASEAPAEQEPRKPPLLKRLFRGQ
ncbi:MAG TPA: hypothetical protein VFB38_25620 [Chthonomonadaceae bacterium]|nr:hypothetical protein [Chthonomonadaceae bacterium]